MIDSDLNTDIHKKWVIIYHNSSVKFFAIYHLIITSKCQPYDFQNAL